MRQLLRIVVVGGSIVALAASVACGGGKDGSASPTAVVASPSAARTSTLAATATPAAATATLSTGVAPSATAAPQPTSAPATQPTVAPPPTSAPPPPPPPPAPAEQSLTIVAKDVKFSPSSLTARAGGVLHLTLDNQDAGVEHDIVLYDASGAVAGSTAPAMGPVRQTLTVTLGPPQRYTFKCSVHPQTMNGALSAQ